VNASISKDLVWEIASEFSDVAKQENIDEGIRGIFVTHIANAVMRPQIEEICRQQGSEPPVICTPQELMEG